MKLLFIVRSIGYGGASKQLALTANAMSERGHEVYIYSYNWNELQQCINESVSYIPQAKLCKSKTEEYVKSLYRIRKVILRIKPDVIISWRANAGCLASLACMGIGHIKHVYSERTDPYFETSFFLKVATFLCRWADGGVFQTEMARDYYGKNMANKSIVIPNPIPQNTKLFDIIPMNQRQKRVAWVGRFFMQQKRMDIMVKVWMLIHQTLPDYILDFYGDGDDMGRVVQMVKEFELEDCVQFKGMVTGIVDIIRSYSLLIMTSDYEGIPNTILEAFISGVPVVTTDCSPGGARVLIEDGVNGYIVPRGKIDVIAEKAIKVISEHDLAEKFVIESRKKLKDFQHDVLLDKWEKYLLKISE